MKAGRTRVRGDRPTAYRAPRSVQFRVEIGSVPRRDRFSSAPRSVQFRTEIGSCGGAAPPWRCRRGADVGGMGFCYPAAEQTSAHRDLDPCFDPGFSAWCRRKLFAGVGVGSSVALGVIAGKCGSLRLVLAGPAGCLRGRWRSGSWKWRHAAGSRARGRKHLAPVGALRPYQTTSDIFSSWQEAPRTCRCIKTLQKQRYRASISGQQAPRTCRCIKTKVQWSPLMRYVSVSKHLAPVGVLRPEGRVGESRFSYQAPLC